MKIGAKLTEIRNLPVYAIFRLIFYPLFMIIELPTAWYKSLLESKILFNGRWERYMGFYPYSAINSMFYRIQWVNINRFGRNNISPVMGLGNYKLRKLFHLSSISSYLYSNAGAVIMLSGTLIWILTNLVWMQNNDWWWVFLVTAILFFSTTSYSMAFVRQNYQILGWMWYPLVLYTLLDGQHILSSFLWFAISIFGITPIFFGVPIVLYIAIELNNYTILLTIVPALTLIMLKLVNLVVSGDFRTSVQELAKLIGAKKAKVKYNREMNKYGLYNWYFTLLYAFFTSVVWYISGSFPYIPFLGLALFIINQRLVRVADDQSLIVLVATLFVATTVNQTPSFELAISLFIVLNPIGKLILIDPPLRSNINELKIFEPFDHTEILDSVKKFISRIPEGEKVIFAYNDPLGRYTNLFDGYRVIHEVALIAATERNIHIIPDWYAVSETNYVGATNIWGRDLLDVYDNCIEFHASHAIVYQDKNSKLSEVWFENFDLLAEFDWKHFELLGRNKDSLWSSDFTTPKWFLLKIKT